MARMRWSGLVTDVKGSLGGTVFSKWKGLTYMKVKPAVVSNPQTWAQQTLRINWALSVSGWRALPSVRKAEWEEYAQSLGSASSSQNQLGDKSIIPARSRTQSGMNAYIGANQILSRAGFTRVSKPPVQPSPKGCSYAGIIPDVGAGYTISGLEIGGCDPTASQRVEVWQKLDRAGAHPHIIRLGSILDPCPAIPSPENLVIIEVRVGTGNTVDEVPIADLLPIGMWVQLVVVSSDGQKGPFGALEYLRLI